MIECTKSQKVPVQKGLTKEESQNQHRTLINYDDILVANIPESK